MSRNRWDGDWPPRTTPIRPADGIRAQSKRGAFASGWWAKRWIAVLEAFQLGTRLTRGRSYARKGQITQIEVFPLNDSYVPYCITFKTNEGTLTMNADRKMLRELYRTLCEEFRLTKLNRRRERELA